jgi:energy-coupling factor transporter transmembrane protein EcfT
VPGRRTSSRRPLLPGNGPLSKVQPAVVFFVVAVLFALGVIVRGPVGATLLGALVLMVLGLLSATWQVLSNADRTLRVIVVLVLVGVAISVLR